VGLEPTTRGLKTAATRRIHPTRLNQQRGWPHQLPESPAVAAISRHELCHAAATATRLRWTRSWEARPEWTSPDALHRPVDEVVLGGRRYATDRGGDEAMLRYARHWPDRVWAIEGCNGGDSGRRGLDRRHGPVAARRDGPAVRPGRRHEDRPHDRPRRPGAHPIGCHHRPRTSTLLGGRISTPCSMTIRGCFQRGGWPLASLAGRRGRWAVGGTG
jgi:hypothetical protein